MMNKFLTGLCWGFLVISIYCAFVNPTPITIAIVLLNIFFVYKSIKENK